MAVYTEVADQDLAEFLSHYELGAVLAFKGIAEGVENSNYLLRTEKGSFILTLYERRVAEADLPFFLGLMDHLAARGVPCPLPVHGRDGAALRVLKGRPAALVTFLDGISVSIPDVAQCTALGDALADLHSAGADFQQHRPNALSLDGWRRLAGQIGKGADEFEPGLGQEIAGALETLAKAWPQDLPAGVIHADLFPDNVLFLGERLSGLIDFYFSCTDALAYDVAVVLNSWCFDAEHRFIPEKSRAGLSAYHAKRPLGPQEAAALPVLAMGAALRFLLTRLYDYLNRQPNALVRIKDPREYLLKMRFHSQARSAADYGLTL